MWHFWKIVLASIGWHLQTPVCILFQISLCCNFRELLLAQVKRGCGFWLSIHFICFQISKRRVPLKDMILPTPGRCWVNSPCGTPRSLENCTQLLLVVIIWLLVVWPVTLQSVETCGLQLHEVLLLPLVSEILQLLLWWPWLFRMIH